MLKFDIGRLMLRHEGENWCAYYTVSGKVADAVPIGQVAMRFVADKEERREAFMALMTECDADIVEDITGARPTWKDPVDAPAHERAGHG